MRVLFTCVSGTGHFHPLVPFARRLVEAGHTVAFSSGSAMAAQVEASGFPFFRAGINLSEIGTYFPDFRQLPPLAQRDYFRTHLFPYFVPQKMLPDLLALATEWSPDLIVSCNLELAGRVSAEARGIPHAVVKAANTFHYPARHKLVPALDELRAMAGLPPDPEATMQFRYLYILSEPPRLRPPAEALPPTAINFRREIFDRSGDEQIPPWIIGLDGKPVVYATLGTVQNKFPGLLQMIIDAIKDEPVNLVVTTGRDHNPADFGEQPPNVYLERYIPQSLLFPYCDLVVSHCGSGSMMSALSFGLPMVNLPIGADQPDNSALCAEMGVGITVEAGERTVTNIRAAVQQVLVNPEYRQNARRVQAEMAALPGLDLATVLLEKLAADKQPYQAPALH